MRFVSRLFAVVLGLAVTSVLSAKEPDNPHVWKPDVRSVAVFKNGLGFFIRDGEVTLRDGWCVAGNVPPALFGTFAIYALDEKQMVDVVGAGRGQIVQFDGQDGPADLAGKLARLKSCKGLNVALTYQQNDKTQTASGKLTEVTDDDADSSQSPNAYAILNKDGQLFATRISELTKLKVLDYPLRVHVEGERKQEGRTPLGMAYLRKGITWIPEYALRVIDETAAELTLRATLVNEVEDLINTDVHFVVGVPSFMYTEFLTPIAVGQAIKVVASGLPVQFQSQTLSNAISNRGAIATDSRAADVQPREVPVANDAAGVDALLSGLPQMGGAGATDFAVYTKQAMTVRKGEKAIVTLFVRRITYSHFYRWPSPGDLKHYLVLHNATDTPWTTGPVIAVSESRPLCQDLIRYTPRGSDYELPVTTAVNVATRTTESEVDRKLKAHSPAERVFLDLVTIEGRVSVCNYEKRAIELEISRKVPGRLDSASHDGRIEQDVTKLKLVERESTVTWRLTLASGEKRELTYRYERYVPSN